MTPGPCPSAPTILDRFLAHAARSGGEPCLLPIDGRRVDGARTRAGLRDEALAWADALHAVLPGERVLLALPDGPELAAALLATWLRGAVAVTLPPGGLAPLSPAIIACADPAVVVADAAVSGDPALYGRTVVRGPAATHGAVPHPRAQPQDAALVQFASGPTFHPRGVVLTHAALAYQVAALAEAVAVTESDRALSWAPLGLDMGLVGGLLMALAIGYPLYLVRPEAVLVQPARWIEPIAEHRITLSAAPTFAYALAARRLRADKVKELDLSAWRVALVGAETVHPEALARFAACVAPAGFRPEALTAAYGLAEATLAVTVAPRGQGVATCARDGRLLARLGPRIRGTDVVIRDERGGAVPDGEVGQVHVRGPGVMLGYLDGARPDGLGVDAFGWLRTGDRGFFDHGQLVLVGRDKEMVIRRGRNVWSEDIEALVAGVTGVGRVFALARADVDEATEGLVVLAEATPAEGPEAAGLVHEIGCRLLAGLALKPSRCHLVPPGALPSLAQGALDRAACRALAGALAGASA